MMIRILYILDEAFPTTSANGRIVYRIIDELIKHHDIQISILCRARTREQRTLDKYKCCKIIHTPCINATKVENLNQKLGKYKWLRYLFCPRTIYYRFIRESDYFVAEAQLWIKRHICNYDVIVANSMPFYPLELAARFGEKKPVILYKMEPVANYLKPNDFETGKTIEMQWDNNASAIIMEDLIYRFYEQYASEEDLRKVVVAKFPCVIRREIIPFAKKILKENVCNLVYVGKFYHKKRDPQFLFSLMDALHGKGIHLTIAGSYAFSKLPKSLIEKYFTNKIPYISYIGELPAYQADELLHEADILVHLGNKVTDQMPSKILDYISVGKPILNIYGIDNCPTLPYMEKYDIQMSIKDGTDLTEDLVGKIYNFCMENKGRQIPFEKIKKDYYDCTPEYVGRQFYDTIKSVTYNNK